MLRRIIPLIFGLLLGLALGLWYTWVVEPVELVNTYPALLRSDYRRDWVRLTALSFVADGDLERARRRLEGLDPENVSVEMRALIEEYAAAGRPAEQLRSLSQLAQSLDIYTSAMWVYLQPTTRVSTATPVTPPPSATASPSPTPAFSPSPRPTETRTPTPSPSPRPTETPGMPVRSTPTSIPLRFRVAEQRQMCERGQTPHIEVIAQDERGAGLPGVEIWLTWPGGAERAITGLKPQQGAGYVDFTAQRGVGYAVGVGELGLPLVTDLRLAPCPTESGAEVLLGSWRIVLLPTGKTDS